MKATLRELGPYALLLAGFLICPDAHSGVLSMGIGADYAQGTYGDPTITKDLYVPFSIAYREGLWKGKLVVPFSATRGTGNVAGGPQDRIVEDRSGSNSGSNSGSGGRSGRGVVAAGASGSGSGSAGTTTTSNSGLGDVIASVTYSLISDQEGGTFLDLTGRVKFGTGSDTKGLGTGENDYSVLIDLDKEVGDWTFSVGTGYTFVGSPPGVDYRNVFSATTGLSYRIDASLSANVYLNYRQASRVGSPEQLDITPGISFRPSDMNRIDTYLLFGLKKGSPDFGVGISYTHSF